MNVCAFADDLVLIAATPIGPNGKSATLHIDINSKPKRWVVNPNPFLRVTRLPGDAALIPATLITQAQKYLDVEISAGAIREKAETKVQWGLSDLTAAPLKLQKRLFILTQPTPYALLWGHPNTMSWQVHELAWPMYTRSTQIMAPTT